MKKLLMVLIAAATVTVNAADRRFVLDAGSLASFIISNTVKPDNGTSYNLDQQSIALTFGYNFTDFEIGPTFYYVNKSVAGSSTKSQGLGAYFKYNFVPNTNENAVIPFAKLKLVNETVESAGGSEEKNLQYQLAGGATFFPINDSVGIDAALAYRDVKDSGSIPGKTSGFMLATAFNLYF